MWAAEGLAHTCYTMYADQPSGLRPEIAVMDKWPGSWQEGRWIEHVREWNRVGQPGGKPPGVKDLAPPVKDKERKDYRIDSGTYLPRPEVRVVVVFHLDAGICGYMC
jgi:mannosyl-oligosaccharide alpha-1,2-mannosidase